MKGMEITDKDWGQGGEKSAVVRMTVEREDIASGCTLGPSPV
jgi:hypothetical protein